MSTERIIFSVFYLSFLVGFMILQAEASSRRNTLNYKYGIRPQAFYARRKLKKVMSPEEKAELHPYERRVNRFFLWGWLIIIVVTATYGLTKAALED